jgi:lycopene beta-cyclase
MRNITAEELLPRYDYIFAGAGCAALSLLYRMIGEGLAEGKRILLVDADTKEKNDRTWCFWEREPGPFEAIVYRRWSRLDFHATGFSRNLDIAPYQYKLIRGIDFYRHCRKAADPFENIHFLQAHVERAYSDEAGAYLEAAGRVIRAPYLFNSIYTRPELPKGKHWLLQHFKGRVIETAEPAFDPEQATLMDFRVGQEEGTTFVYVLPFSERRALVEYTLFTGRLLPQEAYDAALDQYISNQLHIRDYRVEEEEFGVIPMTNHVFPQRAGRILNLGTAGGQTKGSSGYTFRAIQKHSAQVVESMKRHGHPFATKAEARRFHFYDSVLVDILQHRSLEGADIFRDLFRRNDPQKVLRFLDNESSLSEEIQLIATLPKLPFTRAALRQLTGF